MTPAHRPCGQEPSAVSGSSGAQTPGRTPSPSSTGEEHTLSRLAVSMEEATQAKMRSSAPALATVGRCTTVMRYPCPAQSLPCARTEQDRKSGQQPRVSCDNIPADDPASQGKMLRCLGIILNKTDEHAECSFPRESPDHRHLWAKPALGHCAHHLACWKRKRTAEVRARSPANCTQPPLHEQ